MKVYSARSDAFDDSRTGYYATEAEAIDAFWAENHLSDRERSQAQPYTTEHEVTATLREDAVWLSTQGSPSPALGITV